MPSQTTSTVFARYPAALSLPCADPSGLAVEAMLRFTNARVTRSDARLDCLSLTIRDASPTGGPSHSTTATAASCETVRGLHACLQRLTREEGVTEVSADAAAAAMCATVLTEQCLFPAFLFAMHFDVAAYRAALAKSVEPKVATFWEGITGGYRANVLQRNPLFHTGRPVLAVPNRSLSLENTLKLKEVAGSVDAAFAALESMYAPHSASASAFFLGTSKPTYVDALVYAAASCYFHADVAAAPAMRAHQQRLMDACPRLLKYAERLRQQFFQADSATYCLRPRSTAEDDAAAAMAAAADQQYRSGRLQALCWTGVFAAVYFVLSNADLVVALLEGMVAEEEGEEEEAAAAGAADGTNAGGRGEGGGAHQDPREL